MHRLIILALAAAILAACAPRNEKPDPPKPEPVVQLPKPVDKLALLSKPSTPERERIREQHRYDRAIATTHIKGLRYYFFEPQQRREAVGFSLLNTGSPQVNPAGLRRKGAQRQYTFLFADRARENIYLAINDDVKLSGRFSHDNMFRELHFFPRRQLPSLKADKDRGLLKITLPTGEPVLVDQHTMELVGGALREDPIDFNPSRYSRKNPLVHYQGDYLAISVAQRGESPRRAKVWGQTKYAEVHYPSRYAKSCRISPKLIWDQRPKPGDNEPKLTMLHSTDDTLFAMVEKQCNWDLSALKQGEPTRQASLAR